VDARRQVDSVPLDARLGQPRVPVLYDRRERRFEQPLGLPTAGYASPSPDGKQIAYVSPSYESRTWKHYKGGSAADIWIYDFEHKSSRKITDWVGPDEWPMWHGRTIYYCSDRDSKTANLWAYDLDAGTHRQVTRFLEYDVKWPSLGSDGIVFENGGTLYVMDLPSEQVTRISVQVPSDKPATRPEYRNVSKWISEWDLSPSAKRAVFAARGDLFTVPAEKGDVRCLGSSSASHERDPAWSPDGKSIACFSDASGEFEVWIYPADGVGAPRQVTHGLASYPWTLTWSPDSKRLVFSDKKRQLWVCDVANGKLTQVDRCPYGKILEVSWSGDSRWLAYASTLPSGFRRIELWSAANGAVTHVSSGMTDDFDPSFDPQGRYLFFVSRRTLDPQFGAFEFGYQFDATDKVYAVTLRKDEASPVAPQSDEESGASDADSADDDRHEAHGSHGAKGRGAPKSAGLKIDLDGMAERTVELPIEAARIDGLQAFAERLLYVAVTEPSDEGDDDESTGELRHYELESRKDELVIAGVHTDFGASKDGDHALVHADDSFQIVPTDAEAKPDDGKLDTGSLMTTVDPRAEWRQMFDEAWRLERDFYYDPAMGGLDWRAIGERYRSLLPSIGHRTDLNYLLGELIGELGTSHAYVGGGDMPVVPKVDIGLLGADFALDAASGRYKITRVLTDRDWNSKTAPPLAAPGVRVKAGDWLLGVNGRPLKAPDNVYAALTGTRNRQTRIMVGSSPTDSHPREYTVTPVGEESSLRYQAWVRANRERVERASGGRIAYIHVPDTYLDGIREFTRQFFPQTDRDALIIDERWNSGGWPPDFFIERLMRKTWVYWAVRDAADDRTPSAAIDGPKVMLANEYSGSGGDAFPYYFRMQGLGPVIGTRTWGGLVGIDEDIPLVDGGYVTLPDAGMWDRAKGEWVVENHGVDPDIEVINRPELVAAGRDPQLERAIEYCKEQLAKSPSRHPTRPGYKVMK
jgi:tricorn protease